MTTDVTTVSPETPLKDAAELLAEHHISGLPVVDAGRVVGVVSEADIVARSTGAPERRSLVAELLGGRREDDRSAEGVLAGEAMTSPAITIGPRQPLSDAARLMVERKVNRLPVVDDAQLVGIVTRADLVRAFVRPDDELEREIRDDVAADVLWIDPQRLVVQVEEGVVTLSGEVEQRADAELLERLTAAVPGVVAVRSELDWRLEDPKVPASDPRVPRAPRTR